MFTRPGEEERRLSIIASCLTALATTLMPEGKAHQLFLLWPRFRLLPSVYLQERKFFMEEQQIQTFVHAVSQDEKLRKEFVSDPDTVIMREGFSPRLSRVIRKLVPYLEVDQMPSIESRVWF